MTFSRAMTFSASPAGSLSVSCRSPSKRYRTHIPPSDGSKWMSLALRLIARASKASTSWTTVFPVGFKPSDTWHPRVLPWAGRFAGYQATCHGPSGKGTESGDGLARPWLAGMSSRPLCAARRSTFWRKLPPHITLEARTSAVLGFHSSPCVFFRKEASFSGLEVYIRPPCAS